MKDRRWERRCMMFGLGKKKEQSVRDNSPQQNASQEHVTLSPDRIHKSGYVLKDNESVIASERVLTPKGDGWLLVTNLELFFIHEKEGIYLHLVHPMIESLTVHKSKITVSWNEANGKYDYSMKVKSGAESAQGLAEQINRTFHYRNSSAQHIALSESEINTAREKRVEYFDILIESEKSTVASLEPRMDEIADDDPDKAKKKLDILAQISESQEKIRGYEDAMQYIGEIPVVRSYKIPSGVDTSNAWNDCYYDEKQNGFVTFSKRHIEFARKHSRSIQIESDKGMGTDAGIIVENEKIQFRFGYPVVAATNQDGKTVWYILCTMTDEMLTEEIVMARLQTRNKKTDDQPAIYETESEQWIGGNLKMCEKEYEIGHKNKSIYCDMPIEEHKKWKEHAELSQTAQ